VTSAGGGGSAFDAARRHPAVAYALAVAAVAVVTLLKTRLDSIGRDAPVDAYLGAIMLVAWFGGAGPGLVATVLSCLVAAYLFAAPYESLAVASRDDVVRIAFAGFEGTLISVLAGALRRANDQLRAQVRERLLADEALRRAADQVIQAQKLRAAGEFAGGVAHDFNNMLAVVTTCIQILDRRLGSDHPGRAEVDEIRLATERAALLARQLLAFSRRQDVEPKPVHLHAALEGVEPLVRRIVGLSVRVEIVLAATRDRILADIAQLERSIVNLAANARDAMPAGGTLTISTSDASFDTVRANALDPGPHIEVAVRDTGIGMDERTRARVFEPFFTTKSLGEGTGLGLSIVFGAVEAMGGAITVESTPDRGATFRMLLPLSDDE
jgi:signal transduction histidine kinase